MEVRCKHCSEHLFKDDYMLVNAHHKIKQHPTDVGCKTGENDYFSYITAEHMPGWISDTIDQVYLYIC